MEVKLPAEYPNVPPEIMLQSIKNVPGKVCQMLETKIRGNPFAGCVYSSQKRHRAALVTK